MKPPDQRSLIQDGMIDLSDPLRRHLSTLSPLSPLHHYWGRLLPLFLCFWLIVMLDLNFLLKQAGLSLDPGSPLFAFLEESS
jgi:hypothetical protein